MRWRYQGDLHQSTGDYRSRSDSLLRGVATAWLPTLERTWALFDVRLTHPVGQTFRGQGEQLPDVAADAGWVESHWRSGPQQDFSLVAAPEYVTREFEREGVHFTLAVWPRDRGELDHLEASVDAAREALKFLGPIHFHVCRSSRAVCWKAKGATGPRRSSPSAPGD